MLTVTLILLAGTALPEREDHLEPEHSPYAFVLRVPDPPMRSFFPEQRRHVQMMARPSFKPAYAVYVVHAEADVREMKPRAPAVIAKRASDESEHPSFDTKTAPIDEVTLAALEDLWRAALVDVSARGDGVLTFDGTSYHFADYDERFGYRVGRVSTPRSGTKMDQLVQVGELLFAYAGAPEAERARQAAELRRQARAARIRIVGSGPPPDTKGQMIVRSEPPGARIWLDGNDTGLTTPAHLDIDGGTVHDVGFKLAGFRDAERTAVRVEPAVLRAVRTELVPQWVKVQLVSVPSGAAASIDGVEVCAATPCEIGRRPEDGYPKLALTKAGCAAYETTVVLENKLEMPYVIHMRCVR